MLITDALRFAAETLFKQKFKTLMLFIAISIGVISVVLLTGLGEGGRRYILNEFSILGNQTIIMVPGRNETEGGLPPLTGQSNVALHVEDALAIRQLSQVKEVAPLAVGSAEVARKGYNKDSTSNQNLANTDIVTIGTTPELFAIMGLEFLSGRPFDINTWQSAAPQVIIGIELKQQLFANESALGQWLRVGNRRYQIIGVTRSSGANMGLNFNKIVIMPVHSAMQLFNSDALFRVFIKFNHTDALELGKQRVLQLMAARQGGIADVTLVSQSAVLASFNNIMVAINVAIGGIGVISLLVAGILIMNVSYISVTQRTKEIGLLRAVGASQNHIRQLFLLEASMTAILGSALGIAISQLILALARQQFPTIPFQSPWWAMLGSISIALACAIGFAWLPANQAAQLNIVSALTGVTDDRQ